MAEQQFTVVRIGDLNLVEELLPDDIVHIQRGNIDLHVLGSAVRSSGAENLGDAWIETATYAQGDIRSYQNEAFISLQNDNQGNRPNTQNDTAWWRKVDRSASSGSLGTYATGLYSKFSLVFDDNDDVFYYTNPASIPFESTSLQADINAGNFIAYGIDQIIFVSTLPATGITERLYVQTTDNTLHRWTGTAFVDFGGGGASERENTTTAVSAAAQTTTVDFEAVEVETLTIADTINTHTLAVSNLSATERYNTVVIDNSANTVALVLTINDQSGAITFRGAKNDFPGTYPQMNIPAGTIWEINFENRSATLITMNTEEQEVYA